MVASFSLGVVTTTGNKRTPLSTGEFTSLTHQATATMETARARATATATTATRLCSSPSGGNHNTNSTSDREDEKKREDDYSNAIDDLLNKKDDFLDRPFFDPTRYDEDDDSLPGRLANFIKADYPLAEAAFATVYFIVLVVIAKELLRMQLYGTEYVPFTQGVAPGKLF